jgi:hypothetical protein
LSRATPAAAGGPAVKYVQSIYVPEDETRFSLTVDTRPGAVLAQPTKRFRPSGMFAFRLQRKPSSRPRDALVMHAAPTKWAQEALKNRKNPANHRVFPLADL